MLALWGVIVVVSLGLIGTLLGSGLTSDSSLTNHPESAAAQELIDARLPGQTAIDEVIVVRSERLVVSDPAFAARVRGVRRAGPSRAAAVQQISSYLDPGGKILVSADRHATVLPVVLADAGGRADRGPRSRSSSARRQRRASRRTSPAATRSIATSRELSASDLSKGELQFGLPAALIVLLLVVGTLVGVAIPMLMAIISIIVALGLTAVVGQAFQLNLFIVNMIVAMGLALGHRLLAVHRLAAARGAPPRRAARARRS